jgi:hypothetical protein
MGTGINHGGFGAIGGVRGSPPKFKINSFVGQNTALCRAKTNSCVEVLKRKKLLSEI